MGLLQPTPGECFDRQTILLLKEEAARGRGLPLDHFMEEHEKLAEYIEQRWMKILPARSRQILDALTFQLADINNRLWQLEDQIRLFKARYEKLDTRLQHNVGWEGFDIAAEIAQENDRRAELVRAINALFGCVREEKIYREQCIRRKEGVGAA